MPLDTPAPDEGDPAGGPAASAVPGVPAMPAGPAPSRTLVAQPLTRAAFAPFGDVIESGLDTPLSINAGMTERYHDLASVSVGAGGRALISIFETRPYALPLRVSMLERHPLGSQAFVPMDGSPFVVVVAPPGDSPDLQAVQAFVTHGAQGVNYAPGVWHHPLVVTERPGCFVVVDRGGPGPNCDEHRLAEGDVFAVQLPAA